MRNLWFPSKIARYAVGEELKAIKAGKIEVQRDVEFGAKKSEEELELERELNTPAEVIEEEEEPTRQKVTHLDVCSNDPRDYITILIERSHNEQWIS
jgi:hypothetical protein